MVGLLAVSARNETGPDTELETVSGGLETSTSLVTGDTTGDVAVTSTSTAAPATTSIAGSQPRPTAPLVTSSPNLPATTPSTRPAAATTTTTRMCRNSSDPACGPRVWDPLPGPNQPLTVKVTVTPEAPRAGETVTFRVVVDDPDGGTLQGYQDTVDYGDGTPFSGVGGHIDCVPGYGPWDSASVPVHEEITFRHVYANAGTYTAAFKFTTYGNCAYGPSQGMATPTVTVARKP